MTYLNSWSAYDHKLAEAKSSENAMMRQLAQRKEIALHQQRVMLQNGNIHWSDLKPQEQQLHLAFFKQ
jgi:hypothetical protein